MSTLDESGHAHDRSQCNLCDERDATLIELCRTRDWEGARELSYKMMGCCGSYSSALSFLHHTIETNSKPLLPSVSELKEIARVFEEAYSGIIDVHAKKREEGDKVSEREIAEYVSELNLALLELKISRIQVGSRRHGKALERLAGFRFSWFSDDERLAEETAHLNSTLESEIAYLDSIARKRDKQYS